MTNKEAYLHILPVAEKLTAKEIKLPYIPIDTYIQEAHDLYSWSSADKDALIRIGLEPTYIDLLPTLTNALCQAQTHWTNEQKQQKEVAVKWREAKTQALTLRDDLLHAYRFAYHTDEDLIKLLKCKSNNSVATKIISDLDLLCLIGNKHPAPLNKINFDTTLVNKAGKLAKKFSKLTAYYNNDN